MPSLAGYRPNDVFAKSVGLVFREKVSILEGRCLYRSLWLNKCVENCDLEFFPLIFGSFEVGFLWYFRMFSIYAFFQLFGKMLENVRKWKKDTWFSKSANQQGCASFLLILINDNKMNKMKLKIFEWNLFSSVSKTTWIFQFGEFSNKFFYWTFSVLHQLFLISPL